MLFERRKASEGITILLSSILLAFHFLVLFVSNERGFAFNQKSLQQNLPSFDLKLIFKSAAVCCKMFDSCYFSAASTILLPSLSKLPFDRGNQFGSSEIRFGEEARVECIL